MTTSPKNIVVLGGSFGGISAAHYVLKHAVPHMPDKEVYQVVLVSRSTTAICRPACPRAMISDEMIPHGKLFINIPRSFEQYPTDNFRFVHGTATGVDHDSRNVSVDLIDGTSQTIDYHALVIATGASTRSPLISLLRDEESLRQHWASLREALPFATSIVIAGGGPSGVEVAGELGEYLNGRAGWFSYKLENPKVPVTVVTSASQILPDLRPDIAAKAEDFLARVGVTVIKDTRVEAVTPADAGSETAVTTKTTVTLGNGETLEGDIYIPAMGATPNTDFLPASLLAADGRVETNTATLRVEKAGSRVYSIGDASSFGKPSVHNITEAIPVLGANIKRDLLLAAGKTEAEVGEDKIFKEDTRTSQLVPIGQNKGIGMAMDYQLPSSAVWAIKGRDYWAGMLMKLWNGKQW